MAHSAYVTTVIAGSTSEKLSESALRAGVGDRPIHWLKDGVACDIFHDETAPDLSAFAAQYDIITQPTQGRRKQLLISDMDSTMIRQECIDELADYLGIKAPVAAITERAMNGELDFKDALRERVGLLAGLPESALEDVYATRIQLMPGARTLVATMKAHGAYCLLVSGGFTFFTQRIAAAIGFDDDHANRLEFIDGKLSGRVVEPILDKHAKVASLEQCCKQHRLTAQQALAMGDGANDLPMLQTAGLGIAYHAKPIVQQSVRAAINHNDLSAALYAQGYAHHEWVIKD